MTLVRKVAALFERLGTRGALAHLVGIETSPRLETAPRLLFGGGTLDQRRDRPRHAPAAEEPIQGRGVGINGLPILALEPDLDTYYRANVIGGPGAFVIAAASYENIAQAILKKLITEIAGLDRKRIPAERSSVSSQAGYRPRS